MTRKNLGLTIADEARVEMSAAVLSHAHGMPFRIGEMLYEEP